jgi:putative copper resistance protein D
LRALSLHVEKEAPPQPSPRVPGEGAKARHRAVLGWIGLVLNASLVASLAWAGHGLFNGNFLHLAIDISHLLVSAVWPAGLLPFAMILTKLRAETSDEKWMTIWKITRRFSNISLAAVILLTISGILNSWPLVGSVSGLFSTPYGRVLLIKIGLFGLMIAIGAVNLFYLMPHMPHRAAADTDAVARKMPFRLQINVDVEIALGMLVMLAVGLLGLLTPAVEHLLMMRQ